MIESNILERLKRASIALFSLNAIIRCYDSEPLEPMLRIID